jgi:Zn-dependent peptidase ImmA (M78 family)/transcriptional regulator with XRE-family HTH domain
MRPGTPGFVAARLIQAKEARGVSSTNLADMVDVTRESISKYEKGTATPGPDVLARICERLGMPKAFFVQPAHVSVRSPVFFRSMSATGSTARKRAAVLHEWLHEIAHALASHVEMPALSVPSLATTPTIATMSNDMIEDAATRLRRYWGMGDGPISDVLLLLENHGVIVARVALDLDGLDGLSGWFGSRPVVLLNSDKETAVRSRLDLAHELGHLILHRNVAVAAINTPASFKLIETQAFRFGAAFLLPATSFAAEARPLTLEHFLDLKQRWRVSVAMMIQRAVDLRLLDAAGAQYLWRKYMFNRWKKKEPLDDVLPIELPRMLPRAIELLISAGIFARPDIATYLHLPPQDVERLSGLPDGALCDDNVVMVPVQPRLRPLPPFVGGNVIAFRAKA